MPWEHPTLGRSPSRPPAVRSSARTAQGRIVHYLVKEQGKLIDCLAEAAGLSHQDAQRLISFGAVYLDRRRVDSDKPVSPGQYVRVHLQPRRFPVDAADWRATIVHDGDEFVVVNKPAGIPVHATLDNRVENVLYQLSVALDASLYITQRLDTDVGGLIVFAKTQEFQRKFNRLLVERKIRKTYRALVTSAPEAGRHIHYMKPTARGPKTLSVVAHSGWLPCVLSVVNVKPVSTAFPTAAFEVEIDLETGRTHQIRSQLSAMGSPIAGDVLYGSQTRYALNGALQPGIGLFSASVSWHVDEGREQCFALGPPWASLYSEFGL
jgi:RluA family pseudouridine synthase